ncbi:hypothetical protein SAMN05444398_101995 [Roseovarius pacificus]|uniref:Uncharacterized protein n=1 Tax=Roseovarius pacificus TaxID=337701 RepID=A0A1M6YR72_9RHOB|nr:hypothetical protein [Roseovarius pacificus]GGO50492.1 hypothetical protein GCM10011315_01380 [Roseovarius pacificus]SHL20758.1 hypothetical protein SAMN05444398_101995 [Roseovarius pacificus]
MARFFPAPVAVAHATPLSAADLADRYIAMGTMTAQIGGDTLDLVIPYDTEKERGSAGQKMIMGQFLTINVLGMAVDEDGEPDRPMLQVTLQKHMGDMRLLSAELFDDRGYDAPLAMGADGGTGELSEFTMEGDTGSGVVTGEVLRLTGYTSGPNVAEGAAPVPVRIEWRVDLPPLE